MKIHTQRGVAGIIIVALVALVLIGAGLYFAVKPFPDTVGVTPTPTPTPTVIADVIEVKIALLRNLTGNEGDIKKVGCDTSIMKTVEVPQTTMPLNAALVALFEDKTVWPPATDSAGNFISNQKNLSFDKATLVDGVANVYLKGSFTLGGVCDDPRTASQITETAKQFSTVKSVVIYLNDKVYKNLGGKGE